MSNRDPLRRWQRQQAQRRRDGASQPDAAVFLGEPFASSTDYGYVLDDCDKGNVPEPLNSTDYPSGDY